VHSLCRVAVSDASATSAQVPICNVSPRLTNPGTRRPGSRASAVVVSVLIVASCDSTRTVTTTVVPPPAAVNDLCAAYGSEIHREPVNVSATTAGAIVDALRAARLTAAPWSSQPRAEQVARCEYPAPGVPSVSDMTVCANHTAAVVRGTQYFFIDAHGHRTAIPDAVLGPPCSRS